MRDTINTREEFQSFLGILALSMVHADGSVKFPSDREYLACVAAGVNCYDSFAHMLEDIFGPYYQMAVDVCNDRLQSLLEEWSLMLDFEDAEEQEYFTFPECTETIMRGAVE